MELGWFSHGSSDRRFRDLSHELLAMIARVGIPPLACQAGESFCAQEIKLNELLMRALIIEDQERLASLVEAGLRRAGFAVDQAGTLDHADEALGAAKFDLILLDLGLPDGDGMRWLKQARGRGLSTPVLIVTARGELDDRVGGLDTGADDYVTKPFEMDELLARCRALVRRPHDTMGIILTAADVTFDTVARRVEVAGRDAEFGKRETDVLEALLRRPGRVVTREDLEQRIYGFGEEVTPNALEVAVSRIRKKLADAGSALVIHTVRGVGYYLKAE
jgi:two-component system response regulator QseB